MNALPSTGTPLLYDKCVEIASNLWWSWNPEAVNLFRDLDPVRWRKLDHNPIALLKEFTPELLEAKATELALHSRIHYAYRLLKQYENEKPQWARTHCGVLSAMPVAYFSLEFGVHESLPIYSGGLGVLAGDHIKSASNLGVPLVAVGLFYSQGYFKQHLDKNGWQQEEYINTKVENLPLTQALDKDGKPIQIEIETNTGVLYAKVRQLKVGRVRLLLLDTDVEGNSPEDRELTARLYGGDNRTRLRQEMVAGIGGVRALVAMGLTPSVWHLNEGHCVFATLELVRRRMEYEGFSFEDACIRIAEHTVFTTHTPVPAGHDRFHYNLMKEHLEPMCRKLGISIDYLMELGRDPHDPSGDPNGNFCSTVLGLKMARHVNAVSALHGRVSRRMWKHLFPEKKEHEVPIGHITNGVHLDSWCADQMKQLYDRSFERDWLHRIGEPGIWQEIYKVDPGVLWETHLLLKNMLITFARRRLARQIRFRGESETEAESMRTVLRPDALTIGFARRFATYKRATILFGDPDRLAKMLCSEERPVQLIFAGKAHPADVPGKDFIREISNMRHDPRFSEHIFFVEDYDINVARHMVHGVDVWLNTPRRPLEASGTSGQKAVLNGALNLSILDGWWAEAYDGENGFAIGKGTLHADAGIQFQQDAEYLYSVLENEVIPLYFDQDAHGIPRRWVQRMMNSIASLAWRFSADRMVADYVRESYLPSAGGMSCETIR
ncbi:MAG: alpha-glucan family phosphorylase [Thermoguttaceae bacterium]|nr:alpha-glucan family phosphorylase [Thermoguttaceae bacterium]